MLMPVGTVKWFSAQKGHGFIQPDDGSKDVFAHVSPAPRAGSGNLNDGAKVFGTLTLPNGQRIKTMREDAFQAALAASGQRGSR
jgi:CspA family cold shock protein